MTVTLSSSLKHRPFLSVILAYVFLAWVASAGFGERAWAESTTDSLVSNLIDAGIPEIYAREMTIGLLEPARAYEIREKFQDPVSRNLLLENVKNFRTGGEISFFVLDNSVCLLSQIGTKDELFALYSQFEIRERRLLQNTEPVLQYFQCLAANENGDWVFEFLRSIAERTDIMPQKGTASSTIGKFFPLLQKFGFRVAAEALSFVPGRDARKYLVEKATSDHSDGPFQRLEIHRVLETRGQVAAYRYRGNLKKALRRFRFDPLRMESDPELGMVLPSPCLTAEILYALSKLREEQIQTRRTLVQGLAHTASSWNASEVGYHWLDTLIFKAAGSGQTATQDEIDTVLDLVRHSDVLVANADKLLPGSQEKNVSEIRILTNASYWRTGFQRRSSMSTTGLNADQFSQRLAMAGLDGLAAVNSDESCRVLAEIAAQTPGETVSEPYLRYAQEMVAKHCPPKAAEPN